MAVGAYTSTLLLLKAGVSPWIGMLVGGVLSAALGLFIGYLSFRYGIKGTYFALVTLAFTEIARIVALNTPAIGGALGLYIPIQTTDFWQLKFVEKSYYYYVALGFLRARAGGHGLARTQPDRAPPRRHPRERRRRAGARRQSAALQAVRDRAQRLPHRARRNAVRALRDVHRPPHSVEHEYGARDHDLLDRRRRGHDVGSALRLDLPRPASGTGPGGPRTELCRGPSRSLRGRADRGDPVRARRLHGAPALHARMAARARAGRRRDAPERDAA